MFVASSRYPRIGIDFGNTIGDIEVGPASFAFEMIAHMVNKFGAANISVVSKAGPSMEAKIKAFLQHHLFHEETHILPENVIFVREYEEKARIVRVLNISVFFDDHFKVVRILAPIPSVERIYWMHADRRELCMIEKKYRNKIVVNHDWRTTMRYFQRFPRTQSDSRSITEMG